MANINHEVTESNTDVSRDSSTDKSFVGKFVSGILSNTPLSKWFGKEAPGVRRRDDDDDELEVLRPLKRPKLPQNSYSARVVESPVTVHNSANSLKVLPKFPDPEAGPSGIKSRKLFQKYSTSSTNTVSSASLDNRDAQNGEKESDSEESTSGYSSAPKLQQSGSSERELQNAITKSRSLFTPSDTNRHTLFPDKPPTTSLGSRRPSFNASTFGSPNFVDRTLSTQRILSSPFYAGNTTYGGASAAARPHFSRISDELIRKSVQIKPTNVGTKEENATLSKTARRILKTLEQYSTPINDAKKIPVTPRRQGLLSGYLGGTPYGGRERKKAAHTELQIPELLQMKQKERLQSSTESVRQIAASSKSSLNKEEYKLRTNDGPKQVKHTNKIKSNVSSGRHKSQLTEKPVSEVKLPLVPLTVTSLPKFDFTPLPPADTKPSDNTQVISKPPEKKETEKKLENGKTNHFTFSEPLIVSKDQVKVASINCFKFSEPLVDKQTPPEGAIQKPAAVAPFKTKNNGENVKKAVKSAEKWECPTCLVRNGSERKVCEACHEPKPEEEKARAGFGEAFKMSEDKWECEACMVRNDKEVSACVACTTPKTGLKPKSCAETPKTGFGDLFKPPAATWECSSCLIRNKNELDLCAACSTPKPGAKVQKTSITTPEVKFSFGIKPQWECKSCQTKNTEDVKKCSSCKTTKEDVPVSQGFGNAFKRKEGLWECSSCLVNNKADTNACVCCGVSKPGTSSEKLSEIAKKEEKPVIGFNFGINTSTPVPSFKFGIPETTKATSSTPSFVFGVPPPKETTAATATTSNLPSTSMTTTTTTSSGFTFGTKPPAPPISATSSTAPVVVATKPVMANPLLKPGEKLPEKAPLAATGFKFSVDAKVTAGDSVAKPTSVPMFQFKPPAINGDLNKVTSKAKESVFGETNKPKDGEGFGSSVNTSKAKETIFATSASKPKDSIFGGVTEVSKTKESIFGGEVPKPKAPFFGATSPPTGQGIFGDVSKPNPKAIFGDDFNKPKEAAVAVFGGEPVKPFGGDTSKVKDSPFAMKPSEPAANFFASPSTASFNFNPKPAESAASSASSSQLPVFKFGGETASKPFGAVESTVVSNGFGPTTQVTGFGAQNTSFGSGEVKPFAFGSTTDSAPKNSGGFTFGQASKAPTNAPVFGFASGAAPTAPSSSGFNFSAPGPASGGFNFNASKMESPAFGSPKVQSAAFGAPKLETSSTPFGMPKTETSTFGAPKIEAPSGAFGAPPKTESGGAFGAPKIEGSGAFGAPKIEGSGPFGAPKIESSGFGVATSNVFAGGAKNGSFNFGSSANNNAQKAIFTFGGNNQQQQQQQQQQPMFGAPQQPQAPPFSFGPAQLPAAPAVVPAMPPGQGGFNFTGAPPSFSFTDGGAGQPQRKFKRAVRRTTTHR